LFFHGGSWDANTTGALCFNLGVFPERLVAATVLETYQTLTQRFCGTHRLKKAGVLQKSWAKVAIPFSNQLENHSGFRVIREHQFHRFPNAPGGKRSACRPHID
jgi:hypothetical protein